MREEIRKIQELMEQEAYVTDPAIATSVYLAMALKKPLLIEGHAGVGKTEIAKVLARALDTNLIRLQCYEGLDATTALYEWNYSKQLLRIKLEEASAHSAEEKEAVIFSEPFLLKRPLLQAITQETKAPVLLIDEVDRCVTGDTLIATTKGLKLAREIKTGDKVMSFNPVTFLPGTSTVKKVIERKSQKLLRIFVGGRVLETTPEHKFIRYTNEWFEVVRGEDLQVGDYLPLHKSLPFSQLREPLFDFPDAILKIHEEGKRLLHDAYKQNGHTYKELAERIGISRNHLRNVLQPKSYRDSLRANVLKPLCDKLGIDRTVFWKRHVKGLQVQQGVPFYELLGYIVADGCFNGDHLCIADKDRANLEVYAEKFTEAFGDAPVIRRGPHRNFELCYWSLPLGRYLKHILGQGLAKSRDRRVPSFIYHVSPEKRAAFLRGYFDGEGWVGHHQVNAGSASLFLLIGVQHLLSSVGLDSHVSPVDPTMASFGKGPYFQLTVNDVHAFSTIVGFCSPAKRKRLQGARPPCFTKSERLPRFMVEPALQMVRAGKVLHQLPHHQTVYDILSRRVSPNVSSLRRIVPILDSPVLTILVDGRVILGKVSRIETLSQEEKVYDFVLDGQPYFVANQVLTHNCDEEFEAFLLEILSDFQVTIPEIGTIKATHHPYVVLTSNRSRELSDALRRRCLYLWIDYPSLAKELKIVQTKVPGINERLAGEIAGFMQTVRKMKLNKVPGVAETLDWATALVALHASHLDGELVRETLGCFVKDEGDLKKFQAELEAGHLTQMLNPLQ